MKTEPPPRHHGDARPTESLIHPDRTILEEWLRQAIAKGPAFWGTAALIVVVASVVAVVALRWTSPNAANREAWASLMASTTEPESSILQNQAPPLDPAALEAIYDLPKYQKTNAARWARLESATALLSQGSAGLTSASPVVRAEAVSKILQAQELLQAARDATQEEALKRLAEFSLARVAEARLGLPGDNPNRARLDEVLEDYRHVADAYPNTPEGQAAARLIDRLDREESRGFYESLASNEPDPAATGSPSESELGPGGEMFMNPGQSQTLEGLFGEPGAPAGSPPGGGDSALPPTFPDDLPSPDDPPSAPPDTMPEPVAIPKDDDERTKAPPLPTQPLEIEPPTQPQPEPSDATEPPETPNAPLPAGEPEPVPPPPTEPPTEEPAPEPAAPDDSDADEPSGELPDDPFARPGGAPEHGGLPDDPFARPRTGGSRGDTA